MVFSAGDALAKWLPSQSSDLPPIFVPLSMFFQLGEFGKVEP